MILVQAVPLQLPAEDDIDGKLCGCGRILIDDVDGAFCEQRASLPAAPTFIPMSRPLILTIVFWMVDPTCRSYRSTCAPSSLESRENLPLRVST